MILISNLSCFTLTNPSKAVDNYLHFLHLGYLVAMVCLPAGAKGGGVVCAACDYLVTILLLLECR